MRRWTPAEISTLRESLEARFQERTRPLYVPPDPPPIYDEIYFEGVAWLDSLSYSDSWPNISAKRRDSPR